MREWLGSYREYSALEVSTYAAVVVALRVATPMGQEAKAKFRLLRVSVSRLSRDERQWR